MPTDWNDPDQLLSTINKVMRTDYEHLDGIPLEDLSLLSVVLLNLVAAVMLAVAKSIAELQIENPNPD